MSMVRRLSAEFAGTFWLVLGGCGSAVIAAGFPDVGIGLLGVSLAFGLTVLTAAYAVGPISGGHFNPAVTLGLWVAGRFPARDVAPYIWAVEEAGRADARALQESAAVYGPAEHPRNRAGEPALRATVLGTETGGFSRQQHVSSPQTFAVL
mgnify:CR=1 FL=1